MTKNSRGPRVFYVNDTTYEKHAGCMAVQDAHYRMLKEVGAEIVAVHYVGQGSRLWTGEPDSTVENILESTWGKALYDCDWVVVNGEGTIHHGAGLHLLMFIRAAQMLGKRTFLVNCLLEDVGIEDPLFARLDLFATRDPESWRVGCELGGHPVLFSDSITAANFLEVGAKRDFSDSIVVGDGHPSVQWVTRKLETLSERFPFFPLISPTMNQDWELAVLELSTAKLYITGRHHGIYLAALANIPFIALPSNNQKIESLLEWSGLPLQVMKETDCLDDLVRHALDNKHIYSEFRDFILANRPENFFAPFANMLPMVKRSRPPVRRRMKWFYRGILSRVHDACRHNP